MFIYNNVIFSCSALNGISLKCVSLNNKECKVRPIILNINTASLQNPWK